MNLSRKTVMLLQYSIVPISALVHGLIALLLFSLVQILSGEQLSALTFGIVTVVATVWGALSGSMRLGETEFE